jgi:GTP-binding protein
MKPRDVSFSGSAASAAGFPSDGLPEVAFLGRSNVGKSSLLNALAGRAGLARVSKTPGRTRLVNFFRVDDELYLADLPGYGYARATLQERQRWETLARTYLEGRAPLALCVCLVDARHDPMPSDELLRSYVERLRLQYLIAATKADKLGRSEQARRTASLRRGLGHRARAVLAVSARTGAGIPELWKSIRAAVRERHKD